MAKVSPRSRALGLGRRRVERWSRFIVLPERNAMEPKACTPAHFEALLSRRFTEGATSVRLLFGEVKQQGHTGSYSHLARFIAPWKDAGRPLDFIVETPLDPASPGSVSRCVSRRLPGKAGQVATRCVFLRHLQHATLCEDTAARQMCSAERCDGPVEQRTDGGPDQSIEDAQAVEVWSSQH
jgi:hypothetical protein